MHSESKASGQTQLISATAQSMLATSCALKPCTFQVLRVTPGAMNPARETAHADLRRHLRGYEPCA